MNNLVTKIFPKNIIIKTENEIKTLGLSSKLDVSWFLLSRLIIEIAIFILLVLIPKYGLIISLGFVIFFHLLYKDLLISGKVVRRENRIRKSSLEYMYLLKIIINKEQDLYNSLDLVNNSFDCELTRELKKSLKSINTKELYDCILDFNQNIPNQDFKEVMLNLSSADSINDCNKIIDNYILLLENNKDLKIQNKVNNLPILMIISMIVFLGIILFLILYMPKYI